MSTTITTPIQQVHRPTFFQRLRCVLKAWRRQPSQVATICPSSPQLTRQIADRHCIREANVVVELGPGAGGTTSALLDQLPADAELLAIEKTEAFEDMLKEIGDARLKIEIGDATNLVDMVLHHRLGLADVVVSGIPFSYLSEWDAKKITQAIHAVLKPGGTFIAYQMKPLVKEYARPLFGPARTELIPVNVPPLTAFVWTKYVHGGVRRNIA